MLMQPDLHAQLDAVRAAHPLQTCTIYGHCWTWLAAGRAGDVILLLPGALGEADTSFQYILALQQTHRIAAVGYPPSLRWLTALLDGLHTLLEQMDVAQAHVVGGSYSGLVAQYFAARWPRCVRSLLLANTAAPGEALPWRWTLAASAVQLLPEPWLQRAMRAGIGRFLPGATPAETFWREYFAASLPRWSKQAIVTRLHLTAEMQAAANAQYLRGSAFGGPVLIVDAEADRLVARGQQQALRRLYPQAQHAAIAGKGHVAALDEAEAYIKLYREFLCHLPTPSAV